MKKNLKRTLQITLIAFALLFVTPSEACVDYHGGIWVSYEYDSSFTEVLIRVNNMELFGGPQGAFCTCGISNYTSINSNILYVSFVDSGTVNPTAGFMPWTASSNASTAWDNAQAGNWDGFLAETTASLTTGHPVDLIIRVTLPPGSTQGTIDSSINSTTLGTDEYDINGDSLALSHNDISGLFFWGQKTLQPLSYFYNLDNSLTSVQVFQASPQGILAFPNPFSNEVNFELNIEVPNESQIFITDLGGRVVHNFLSKDLNIGVNQFRWRPGHLPSGVYLLQYRNNKALRVQHLIFQP